MGTPNTLHIISSVYSPEECRLLELANQLAEKSLSGVFRGNGAPFVSHAHAVAAIVADEMCLPPAAVFAVLLHEASRKHPELLLQIKKDFSKEVYSMTLGLNRISTINPNDTRLQAENYRKLIVAYSTDPSVVLIKLADRLEIMRSLELFPKAQQLRKATETLMLYAPLAHQLGMYKLKSELEDLSFKHSEPEAFKNIDNKLKSIVEGQKEKIISSFAAPIEAELKAAGIIYELKSRTKTAYSIWKKMQSQQVTFEKVFDILAVRFIIDTPPDREEEHALCWKVYSLVSGFYAPDTRRMRDWISHPKSSGYESLHTTVTDTEGRTIEVQIRTRRMNDVAETGMAAHWSYKGVKREEALQEWLNKVRDLLQSDHPEAEYKQYFSQFKLDEVFVFTPVGDLLRLPSGATVLDFAFAIHSNVGTKCIGARIQNKVVPIREKLQTGDVIEIITSKNQKPSKDWVNIVVTNKAKNKIRQKLREEEGKKDLVGRELLERRMKNWKIELNDEVLNQLLRSFKLKNISDLYSLLAQDGAAVDKVKETLQPSEAQLEEQAKERERETPAPIVKIPKGPDGDYLVIDHKLSNVAYKLAKCCNPSHGDEVFGFVTATDGIKLHRTSCPNAPRLYTQYKYRIIEVEWKQTDATSSFQTTLQIVAEQEHGLSQQIGDLLRELSINLRSFSMESKQSHKGKDMWHGILVVLVNNNQQLDRLMVLLRRIRGIKTVSKA